MRNHLKFLPLLLVAVVGCRSDSQPATLETAPATNDATAPVDAATPTESVAPAAPEQTPTALDRYIARAEKSYKWTDAPELAQSARETDLRLVSQTWQGKDWTHRLQIFTPQKMVFPDAALINVSYGSGSLPETFAGQVLADATGTTIVNLFNVPNQPLYDRTEDDLIAYTFEQYLKTGDETWPLLLPMTKSVTQGMNALQEWSAKNGKTKIKRFIVSGASKRGWTTDLVGAVDPRVVGIVPIVYDNLNLNQQIPHQKEIWGKTSDMTGAYNDIGLFEAMQTEVGQKLVGIIDPYAYKSRLTMPKLFVHATNDQYWSHDSAQFYWSDLPGQNRLFEVPNVPHTLGNEFAAVAGSAAAWSKLILAKQSVPDVALRVESTNGEHHFSAKTEAKDAKVRLWFASAPARDFRQATWRSVEMKSGKNGDYELSLDDAKLLGAGKNAAAFAEIEIAAQPLPLRLSSQLWETGGDTEGIRG